MLMKTILTFLLSIGLLFGAMGELNAQETQEMRAQTGGAQTLEDIMARQRGETVDDQFRRDALGADNTNAGISEQLGPLGGTSDAELWRDYRFGTADLESSDSGPTGTAVMQDGGMRWLNFRNGPLRTYGGYLLLGMMGLLVLFYLIRGKIMIEGEKTGETILRFKVLERFAHWLTAIPFLFLGVTGLVSLFGRVAIIPLVGREMFSSVAIVGKLIHNYVAWAFMAGIILSFVLWVWDNLPERTDIGWLLKGGGMFTTGSHPPAGKFNAGEKIVFWSVIWFGVMVSLTGLSLLFPYQVMIFAPVFDALNYLNIPQVLGMGELSTTLAPQEEMQLSLLWHSIIAFIYMAIIIAHIYLGSVGMEGALDSMTNGKVETQWAKEHHSLWYEDEIRKGADTSSDG